jgi:FKBP-type peptidyl-prolyl cis-trans isomerase SlpA
MTQAARGRSHVLNHVQSGSFLTLHYRLAAPDGADLVNTFGDKPATLSLGTGELAPALEARLIGLAEGARAAFELAPGEAFGERNPELLQRVSLAMLRRHGDARADYAVGDLVHLPAPAGAPAALAGVVCEAGDGWRRVDFNHPLAGRPVRFEVQLIGVL